MEDLIQLRTDIDSHLRRATKATALETKNEMVKTILPLFQSFAQAVIDKFDQHDRAITGIVQGAIDETIVQQIEEVAEAAAAVVEACAKAGIAKAECEALVAAVEKLDAFVAEDEEDEDDEDDEDLDDDEEDDEDEEQQS